MNIWHDIEKARITPEKFEVVIEIPAGSKVKFELDKETGFLKLDRILHTSMRYPANYGFIPKTYGDDKDPLDALVLCSEEIAPMTLVECRPIGVIMMIDGGEMDEKILAIPAHDPLYNCYNDVSELPAHLPEEMKHFFEVYKDLENKKTEITGIEGKEKAISVIKMCLENYKTKFGE